MVEKYGGEVWWNDFNQPCNCLQATWMTISL
jgi:hypothetical protein